MEELAVIDYNTGEIHVYKVPKDIEITDEYLDNLGHRGKDCYWLVNNSINIIKHENI